MPRFQVMAARALRLIEALPSVPWGKLAWGLPIAVALNDNAASVVVPAVGVCISPALENMPRSLDVCFVLRNSAIASRPTPGDLVAVTSPFNPREVLVKRLVGLENDIVRVKPQNSQDNRYQNAERVRPGCCWVSDDDTDSRNDSRVYGQVPLSLLQGRVRAVLRLQTALPLVSVWSDLD